NVALSEEDEEAAWQPVVVLHYRGTREIFEIARNLCESQIPKGRKLGVDILGQLGTPERPFKDESLPILFALIENEQDTEVLSSVGVSLGHINDARVIKPLIKLKNHPSADVRFGVVHGLLGQEDDLAIKTLIELSKDEAED